jgi:hypothetical protein
MKLVDLPARFPTPFASSAGVGYIRTIPTAHQVPTGTDAPASLYDGFQPPNFVPLGSGGLAVDGRDMNGLHFQETSGIRWMQAGGAAVYNSAFSTAIGGYPRLSILASTTAGTLWQSTADDNSTDPDGGSPANWVRLMSDPQTTANSFVHPNGAIEQWGETLLTSTGEPVVPTSLPISYGSSDYGINVSPLLLSPSTAADTWIQVIESTVSTSGFSVQYQRGAGATNPNLDGYRWRTIGYGAPASTYLEVGALGYLTSAGNNATNPVANSKWASPITVPSGGVWVKRVFFSYFSGTTGVKILPVIYSGSGSSSDALFQQGQELICGSTFSSVVTELGPINWKSDGSALFLPAGSYLVGAMFDSSGMVIRNGGLGVSGLYGNTDTYSDGASATFGTVSGPFAAAVMTRLPYSLTGP